MQSQKWHNHLCSFPSQIIQYNSNSSLCPNQGCWSWTVLWRPTRPSRTNTSKRWLFYHRGLECKSRKSRNTCSNRQIWPWNAEWSRAKTNRVCQENTLVIANTLFQKHRRQLYTWTSPEIRLIVFFATKDGEALNSQQKQDQELTVAQIMSTILQNSDLNWRQ